MNFGVVLQTNTDGIYLGSPVFAPILAELNRRKATLFLLELAAKIEPACGDCTRISIGGKVPGWHEYEQGYSAPAAFQPEGETRAAC